MTTEPEPSAEEKYDPLPIRYATFNDRVMATAIDLFLIMLVALPVLKAVSSRLWPATNKMIADIMMQHDATQSFHGFMQAFLALLHQRDFVQQALFENAAQFLFIAVYVLPFWFCYSTTPGKLLLRMEIKDAATLTPMTRRQATIRFASYIVSFLPISLGFLWVLFNKKHRGFHDMIANTVVTKKTRKRGKDKALDV